MTEEKKQFPTPAMLKAREEWEKKTPQEREAIENILKEQFREYYENRPSREYIQGSIGENQDD